MQNEQSTKNSWIWTAVIFTVIMAVGTIATYVYQFWSHPIGQPSAWATFANYVTGIMTPIVGMVTLVLLVKTLLVQQEELRLQRLELHRQGSAAENSAKALDEQLHAMFIQNFEQSFFSWLATYQKMVASISITDGNGSFSGLHAISRLVYVSSPDNSYQGNKLYQLRQEKGDEIKKELASLIWKSLSESWWKHNIEPTFLAHFKPVSRTLTTLINWMAGHKSLNDKKKGEYMAILKAHLSEAELALLYFYCLFSERNDLQVNVEKYAILDGLRESESHPYVNFYVTQKSGKLSCAAFGVALPSESTPSE